MGMGHGAWGMGHGEWGTSAINSPGFPLRCGDTTRTCRLGVNPEGGNGE